MKFLNHTHDGLIIEEMPEALSIIINQNIASPLMLPEAKKLKICVSSNVEAHFFASNAHVDLILEPGAQVSWYGLSNKHINLCAHIKAHARLALAHINLANPQAQCVMNIELLAPEAEVSFVGLDLLSNNNLSSMKLHINHRAPSTRSTQAFRGIYADNSCGAFEGLVSVAAHAENSSAMQLYKAIILSESARAHVKPELEINNFNIAASHGASIGQLDPEALFYLRSRGLSKEHAQKILVTSLAQDIVQEIHPLMREYLSKQVDISLETLHE
jgi:Fe-S cluster assembly protein SufD